MKLKITQPQINEIFSLDRKGMKRNEISKKFNVSNSTICNILNGYSCYKETKEEEVIIPIKN